MKARFEVLKMKVRRGPKGSSGAVVDRLNRALHAGRSLVYLKHNTLVNDTAYWTAIIENRPDTGARSGWGVAIIRVDGTEFLSCASPGLMPGIFPQRSFAVTHKRALIGDNFNCRVVRVSYAEPEIVS